MSLIDPIVAHTAHGYFKTTFDRKTNPQDSVTVSLYRRMWPRSARAWSARAWSVEMMEMTGGEAMKEVEMEVDDGVL